MTRRSHPLGVMLALLVASSTALGLSTWAGTAGQQTAGTGTGLLVTVAATGEEIDAPAGEPARSSGSPAGLTIQLSLENQVGADLAGIRVRAPVPPRTQVATSWIGEVGSNPGAIDGQHVIWRGLELKDGTRLGPLAYRVVPAPDADGAVIFLDALLRPEISWTLPSPQTVGAPELRLNGLWGEGGLRRSVLPTGLTILTRERPDSATTALRMAVRAGSRDEDDTTSGGSHWLEHAFFLGTEGRSTEQIHGAVADVGGQLNASTAWEMTDYWYWVPAEHFDLALDLLADQLVNSTFGREEFDRERRVVFEELKLRQDTPAIRAFDEFINVVFRVSPLRRHPGGTIDSVQSIPIETILAYKNERYVTGNMAIAAVGDLRHDETVAKIERAFRGLAQGARGPRPRAPEPVQAQAQVLELGNGETTAEIRLGWPVVGADHADAAAVSILEDVLGATGRRLAEEVRDRRALALSVSSSYLAFSDAGVLMISASTTSANADQVVEVILDEIRRLRDGDVSDDEVGMSLRAIAGRRALSEESNQQQTTRARAEVSHLLESAEERLARLRSVAAQDVQRVAQTYLHPDHYTLVIIRP